MKISLMACAILGSFALAGSLPAAEEKSYPLTTCVVSGEKLGEMGEPYVFIHEGREVRFCCEFCKPKFEKDLAKYLKLLDEAEKNKPQS